jgi:hypothetical protein
MRLINSKSNKGRVSRIEANNIREAKFFFMGRKRMDEKTFDKLYIIVEDSPIVK